MPTATLPSAAAVPWASGKTDSTKRPHNTQGRCRLAVCSAPVFPWSRTVSALSRLHYHQGKKGIFFFAPRNEVSPFAEVSLHKIFGRLMGRPSSEELRSPPNVQRPGAMLRGALCVSCLLVQLLETDQMFVPLLGGLPQGTFRSPGTPVSFLLGGTEFRLRQGFATGKTLVRRAAARSSAGPGSPPHRTAPRSDAPGRLMRVLFTCTAPGDGPDVRTAPWRTPRSRQRVPWRGRGTRGSGRSSGPRSSGTPDSRRPGPWSPG